MNIDFKLLKKQKETLLEAISLLKNHKNVGDLHGILHLLDAIQDEHEDGKKEYYFLFGENVCNKYHEADFSEVVKLITEGTELAIHKFVEGEHPENIMEAASGWMDYAMITKEEYQELENIEVED